ncbi:MAG: alkaline phosphatase family protein [Gemmatimonadetes bacterium]|nr:alkaline phosphatase family protein [Gemmatimonadota bacterium]
MKRCLLLLVDGLRPDVAEAALARGELPALAALTGAQGRTRGITVFPSTTSVAYLPFLTGCTPGRCNIPSIRWMDRERYTGRWWAERDLVRSYCGYQAGRLDGDVTPGIRTIFELVPESLGIFTPVAQGLTPARNPASGERQFWGALAHYAEWHQPSDDAVTRHLLRGVDAGWRFIFAQFPAVDGYTHQSTPDGPKVLRALRLVDATVARVVARLRARGELDDTLIVMVSDHGASVVHTHLDLATWFRGQGVRTLSHPVIWERDPAAAVMVAGNGSAMVYARPGVPRRERWPLARLREGASFGVTQDVIAALLAEPAVACVAAEERPGVVRVAAGDGGGEALLESAGERIAYRRLTGDPLGVRDDRSLTAAEWLAATWDGPYPDGVVQLLDQFRAPRTADLLVIAREGYDFRERFEVPEHKAGHGSLIRAHMQVPVWASVPVPSDALRTVDVFPAMLEWLEVPVPGGIDGQRVWSPGAVPAVA